MIAAGEAAAQGLHIALETGDCSGMEDADKVVPTQALFEKHEVRSTIASLVSSSPRR